MEVVMTGAQFVVGCLVLGLGLFLAGGAVRELLRARPRQLAVVRALAGLAGFVLLAAGLYAARLSVPL